MATRHTLTEGFQDLAFKLQEAAMMHSDVRARLADTVNDAHRESGDYGSYIDHDGDGESGDCIYSCNGDIRKAPYEIANQGGKATAHIDMDDSTNVVPVTSYQEEADEDDHYAGMQESFKTAKLYADLPVYERFISKSERDNADSGDFAGKGKSFPILKPSDVSAAVHAMGRAGSSNLGMAALKANIIRIAKKKGWTSSLPKSWQSDSSSDSKEAIRARQLAAAQTGSINLVESAATLETIVLKEAKADYEIKLIAPGKGSSAFYPAEVLKRDGPKVFNAGTHVYLNHPTSAEEAARPEGDVKNLAGVLTTQAQYHENHAKGPGLYARMKVFADHAQTVEEKAAHVGMSIRASGVAESGKQKDGLPILKELTSAESVDVVTRAGAGGMILSESARTQQGDIEMTEAEINKLVEAGVAKALASSPVKALEARALRGDAMVAANSIMSGLALHESAKARVVDIVTREGSVPMKDGAIDQDKFKVLVMTEAQREAAYIAGITGVGNVFGMGPSGAFTTEPIDYDKLREAEKRQRKENKRIRASETDVFADLMGNRKAAELAVGK
jgi:hypothetical protein